MFQLEEDFKSRIAVTLSSMQSVPSSSTAQSLSQRRCSYTPARSAYVNADGCQQCCLTCSQLGATRWLFESRWSSRAHENSQQKRHCHRISPGLRVQAHGSLTIFGISARATRSAFPGVLKWPTACSVSIS